MATERILITGGPRCGKSTLANQLVRESEATLMATDATREMPWSDASATVAQWFDMPGLWVIEGVVIPRALRKWLAVHPEGKPCDTIIFLGKALQPLEKGQVSMFKGVVTVFAEVLGELKARGVKIDMR